METAANRNAVVGRKDDAGKDRWDLVPFEAMVPVVKALTGGAVERPDDNWRYVENGRARYYAASLRHMTKWWLGERLDPDTGLHHLAHAVCSLLFLIAIDEEARR